MINKCPECGGEVQATVPLYLSDVVLDDNGNIQSYEFAFGDFSEGTLRDAIENADGLEVRIYCENDHDIERLSKNLFK